MQLFFLLQTAFSIWMLIDAIKRRSQYYWFIIVMVPFGEWVYFFMVKIHDPEFKVLANRLFYRPPSLKKLRYQARTVPSVQNKLILAYGLHDEGQHAEAVDILKEIVARSQNYKEALHCLARCQSELNEQEEAIEVFKQLVALDIAYADYGAARELADLYGKHGLQKESLIHLRTLAQKSPRIGHLTALSACLIQNDRGEEAKKILKQALEDFENAPRYVRRRDRTEAKTARKLWRDHFAE